jgi:glucose-6-phosphate 1-dehydrogenase
MSTRQTRHGIHTHVREEQTLAPTDRGLPCAVVIFGVTGDLSQRKLGPALLALHRDGKLPKSVSIVGVGRRDLGDDGLRDMLHEGARAHGDGSFDEATWRGFAERIRYVQGEFEDPGMYRRLKEALGRSDEERGTEGNRLFYLATPPQAFLPVLAGLREGGLIAKMGQGSAPWTRVVIEKPFGRDLDSALELNRRVLEILQEDQVFRIDHYLGKETVQNILVFRLGNTIWEPLWNRKYIDHVQITAAETVDAGDRGAFYDRTGVLRDLVQNHLLQVLALCAMEPPVSFQADDIRDAKVQTLRSLRRLEKTQVAEATVRGQYAGYRDVKGVAADSRTPTYTAIKVHIDNWRWQGVPFYLRTGKALSHKVTEVVIRFQSLPFCLFGDVETCQRIPANELILRIQPDEGIALRLASKSPGSAMSVASIDMDFSYSEAFGRSPPDAYDRLLLDAIRGDATLFARGDEMERAWRFCAPILEAWEDGGEPAVYEPGSAGPKEADQLLWRDRRAWKPLG